MRSNPFVTGFWYFDWVEIGDAWWAIEGRSLQNAAQQFPFKADLTDSFSISTYNGRIFGKILPIPPDLGRWVEIFHILIVMRQRAFKDCTLHDYRIRRAMASKNLRDA